MSSQEGAPARIVGRRSVMSRRQQRLASIAAVIYIGLAAWLVASGRSNGIPFACLAIMNVGLYLRPPTVVDATGIRRPWRRRSAISWDQVDHVVATQPGFSGVRMTLRDGRTVTLDDVPAEESAAVAAIGGIPVARPAPTPLPPPRPARRTDQEIEADVDRRARALQERAKQLDTEYRRLRGRRPDDPV